MAVTVAQGVVIIEADTKNVSADVVRALESTGPKVKRAADDTADSYLDAFKRSVAAGDLDSDIIREIRDAASDSGREGRRAGDRYVDGFDDDLDEIGSRIRREVNDAGDIVGRSGASAGRGWVDSFKGSFLGNALSQVAIGAAQQIGDIIGTGIRAAWDFGWSSIDVASGLNEADTALESIFGAGKGAVDSFAKGAARSVGQSELAAKKGAQTFGVYGKAAGLAGEENAKFSTDLVTLAADFASFYDTSPEQAIEAIGAALRGESEPIRTYGVLLDDATLKARAMSMGLLGTSVDMTKVSGAQLKLEAAQKKVNDATAKYGPDSLEARQAMQNVTEAQEELARVTEGVTNESLTPQQRALAAHAEIMAQADVASGDFASTSENLANQQRILAAQFEDAKGKLGESLLPIMSELVTFANDEFMPVFGDIIEEVGPQLGQALIDVLPSAKDFMLAFAENLPAMTELATNALPLLIEGGELLLPVLQFLIENTSTWFGFMSGLLGFLKGDTSLPEFRDKMLQLPGPLGAIMRGAENTGSAFRVFGDWASRTAGTVVSSVGIVGQAVAGIGQTVLDAMSGAGMWLYNSGRAIIQGFVSGIKSMLGAVGSAASSVIDWARSFFPNSPAKRGPLSGAGWTRLKESGGAVIEQWAEGMREASPGVPFDLMGIAAPAASSRIARPTFGDDALAPGVSAPTNAAGEAPSVNVDLYVKSDDPELAGRQFARGLTKRLGVRG